MPDPRHVRGAGGEAAAVTELERKGYRVLERNFRCRSGEIDIVAEQGDAICFIEVRTRRHGAMVAGGASVDARKRRKLVMAARYYCQRRAVGERALRFDVVDVRALGNGGFEAQVLRNAFDAEGQL